MLGQQAEERARLLIEAGAAAGRPGAPAIATEAEATPSVAAIAREKLHLNSSRPGFVLQARLCPRDQRRPALHFGADLVSSRRGLTLSREPHPWDDARMISLEAYALFVAPVVTLLAVGAAFLVFRAWSSRANLRIDAAEKKRAAIESWPMALRGHAAASLEPGFTGGDVRAAFEPAPGATDLPARN